MTDKIEGLGRAQLMGLAPGRPFARSGKFMPQNGLLGLSHFHVISCDFHIAFHYNDRFGVSWSKNMIFMLFSTMLSHLGCLPPRF